MAQYRITVTTNGTTSHYIHKIKSHHIKTHHTRELICRIQNPDVPRTGRDGAAHGGAAARGRAEPGRTVPLALRGIERNYIVRMILQKHEQPNFYANRLVKSKTRTHHGRVGAGRSAAGWRRRAGRGRTERRRVGSLRRRPSLLPSKESKTTVLNVSSKARIREILYNEGTTRLVDNCFIREIRAAIRLKPLTNVPTPN